MISDRLHPPHPTSGAQFILTRTEYGRDLHIVCIGPLTDLCLAVRADGDAGQHRRRHGAGPGVCTAAGIEPDPTAYNLRCDLQAAREVFAALQAHVPFRLLSGRLPARYHARRDQSVGSLLPPLQLERAFDLRALRRSAPAVLRRMVGPAVDLDSDEGVRCCSFYFVLFVAVVVFVNV